ncbi:unnamed protein product [Trifolium pratense]|uniref:Uncharacterized protein n=1 Tax=Trifolium pratense TaxID=57577 RepID=A0ACB0K4E8_TRIPR|nr:unnamed protein product [Trifolium pratense]
MTNEINLEMVKWFLDDSTIYVSRQGCSRIRFDVEVKNCIINMVLLAKSRTRSSDFVIQISPCHPKDSMTRRFVVRSDFTVHRADV